MIPRKIKVFVAAACLLLPLRLLAGYNLDSMIRVLPGMPADTNRVVLLNRISEALRFTDQDSAAVYSDSARSLSEKLNFKRGLLYSLMNLANYNSMRHKFKVALDLNLKALNLAQELKEEKAQVRIYRSIGTTYYGIHDYDNGLKNYEAGLNIAERIGYRSELPAFYSNLGIMWHSKKDFGKAMEYYIKALKLADANKDNRSRSYVMNSMGKLYFDIGKKDERPQDFEQAIKYYKQSLDLKKEMNDKRGMANTLGNIGDVLIERGRYSEALDYYKQGYDLAKETLYNEWLETGCFNMSDIYVKLGDYKNAYLIHKEYVAIKDTLESIADRKAMADLQDKFDDEQRDKTIQLQQKENELLEAEVKSRNKTLVFASAGLVIVIVFAFFLYRSYREKQKINMVIEEKNKNITDSIMYAKRIQTAILPAREQFAQAVNDFFILYKPKDIVSGDFYFFTEMSGKVIIAVADCTGHGVPGAFMSMIGNSLLNRIIKEKGETIPSEILSQLHRGVSEALQQNKDTETRDGMDIALVSIDRKAGSIAYAGANRNLYFTNQAGMQEVAADKSAIGGLHSENEVKFTNHEFAFAPGDTLYLSTDGYADQFGGPEGKKFRTKRFREMLGSMGNKKMEAQLNELESTIDGWMGNNEQLDDILVIGVKL
ncbi:MAG TPA: tetratricopeptide repeat protein [Bacteroidia bacterium]|jgi:serine phosphatase RsbU (regulator of sigma subunit)